MISIKSCGIVCVVLAAMTIPAAAEPTVSSPSAKLVADWKLSPFYKKCRMVGGLPILASEKVSDVALNEAAFVVEKMISGRDDILQAIVANRVRMAIMAPNELTTAIPEHADLEPARFWDKRARGLGATKERPCVSCGEENLLNFPGDPYEGESILVHEFAHVVHEMGLNSLDKTFDKNLANMYHQAMQEKLWTNTYAATNHMEYWAEGVQIWFVCNRVNCREHNHIANREQLLAYDPRLAKLLASVFGTNDWRYTPTFERASDEHLAKLDREHLPEFMWPKDLVAWYEQNGQAIDRGLREKRATPKEKNDE